MTIDLAALLDLVGEAVLVLDREGRIAYWNRGAERLYGRPAAEAIGRPAAELLWGGPSPEAEQIDRQARGAGEWAGEATHVGRDGRPLPVDSWWRRLGEDGLAVVAADATARKRLEALGHLAGRTAHDLNNVLTPLLMTLRMLEQDRPAAERQRLLALAAEGVERGMDRVRRLRADLDAARHPPDERPPFDL